MGQSYSPPGSYRSAHIMRRYTFSPHCSNLALYMIFAETGFADWDRVVLKKFAPVVDFHSIHCIFFYSRSFEYDLWRVFLTQCTLSMKESTWLTLSDVCVALVDLGARKLMFSCCLSRCTREGYRDHEIAHWSGEDRGWIVEGNNCVCTCTYNPFCRLTASWALGALMNGTSGKFSRYVIIARG